MKNKCRENEEKGRGEKGAKKKLPKKRQPQRLEAQSPVTVKDKRLRRACGVLDSVHRQCCWQSRGGYTTSVNHKD